MVDYGSWMTDSREYQRLSVVPSTIRDVAEYIRSHCYYESPHGDMLGKGPGDRYFGQYYLTNLTTNPAMMSRVCRALGFLLEEADIDLPNVQFVCREINGIAFAASLSSYFGVNYFWIRESRKRYAKHNFIEGIPNDKPCLIVDDMANSTNAFSYCKDFLLARKMPVCEQCLAIVNKNGNMLWDAHSGQEIICLMNQREIWSNSL